MKKVFEFMLIAGMAVGAVAQDANRMNYVSILPPTSTTNQTITGSTIDIAAYKGNATLVVYGGTASETNNYMTVTLQHSTASNFASPSTVTNINGTAAVITVAAVDAAAESSGVQTYSIDLSRLHRYVRVTGSRTLADHYIPLSAVLVAPMKAQ